ncbi:hypothetical protein GCM10010987_64640 [Bradyrhizobium guangdongense]|nr:hypothetical protein GCM10010987_64640 [Bradyrhizobium guangdongense]
MTKTGTSDHRILTQRARAAHLAGKVIDERADNSAKGDDQAMRRFDRGTIGVQGRPRRSFKKNY